VRVDGTVLAVTDPTDAEPTMKNLRKFISYLSAAVFAFAWSGRALSEPALWQHHDAEIQYFARGTSYSCNGIEDKVRQILLYAGARRDLRVRASGCDQGPFLPSHMASIKVDFYALAPAADAATAEAVTGQWVTLSMTPVRSQFLHPSDCDLVRAMKSVLTTSFSWHGLDFGASCFPYAGAANSFAVKGAVLQPITGKSG
jgi:hypothetical protein